MGGNKIRLGWLGRPEREKVVVCLQMTKSEKNLDLSSKFANFFV